jgi:hypothetical protein
MVGEIQFPILILAEAAYGVRQAQEFTLSHNPTVPGA